ncbi:MCM2/3/5 family-domain-containing protein [Powellomyces hirtus]|nr:MCM2/3/5 family-domain-containing protein [Powellomyces hirtus]
MASTDWIHDKLWDSYFPTETFSPAHPHVALLTSFYAYFKTHYNYEETTVGATRPRTLYDDQAAVHVDFRHLRLHCTDLSVEGMLGNAPEAMLACLSCAAHAVFEEGRSRNPGGIEIAAFPATRVARISGRDIDTPLKDVKAYLIGKYISIRGILVRATTVKPILRCMSFTCDQCCEEQQVAYPPGSQYRLPSKCARYACRSRAFHPVQQSVVATDRQRVWVKDTAGTNLAVVECELLDDLVDSAVPGDVVSVGGIVRPAPVDRTSQASVAGTPETFLAVNSLSIALDGMPGADTYNPCSLAKHNIYYSRVDLYAIRRLWQQRKDLFRLLVNSVCPSIFGHELVKAGLLLTLLSCDNRTSSPMPSEIHTLIVGDPGLGKSQILAATHAVAPRGELVVAQVNNHTILPKTTRIQETGEHLIHPGALILADQGLCCIDDLTQHLPSIAHPLTEAMRYQSIHVTDHAAGIDHAFAARTCVVAAATPATGHYNTAKSLAENIKMPVSFMEQFDFVFVIRDTPEREMDRFLAEQRIVGLAGGRRGGVHDIKKYASLGNLDTPLTLPLSESLKISTEDPLTPIPPTLLRTYISYTLTHCPDPQLSSPAAQHLATWFKGARKRLYGVNTRVLESAIRAAKARARAEVRREVRVEDVEDAVQILEAALGGAMEDAEGVGEKMRAAARDVGGGTARKGKSGKQRETQRFLARLHALEQQTGTNKYTVSELTRIAKDIQLDCESFPALVETLNHQGYLVRKAPGTFMVMPPEV